MRDLLCGVISLSLLVSSAYAQKPVPTATYELHAGREQFSWNLRRTLLRLLPDDSLLVLIPQQEDKWLLKRVTGWETGSLKEETIAFTSPHPREHTWREEDLDIDPIGTYAVIRIGSYDNTVEPVNSKASAIIVLIDLRSFTVLSQSTSDDLMLAASSWSFAKNGMLIATALSERRRVPSKPIHGLYQTQTFTYQATAFSLPGWSRSMTCHYEQVFDLQDGGNYLSSTSRKAGDECVALIAAAQVPKVEDLPNGPHNAIPNLVIGGQACMFKGKSQSADLTLYECGNYHSYLDGELSFVKSRNLKVLVGSNGPSVLTIPLPPKEVPVPAVLANSDGYPWLLRLRDGNKLEGYRLP